MDVVKLEMIERLSKPVRDISSIKRYLDSRLGIESIELYNDVNGDSVIYTIEIIIDISYIDYIRIHCKELMKMINKDNKVLIHVLVNRLNSLINLHDNIADKPLELISISDTLYIGDNDSVLYKKQFINILVDLYIELIDKSFMDNAMFRHMVSVYIKSNLFTSIIDDTSFNYNLIIPIPIEEYKKSNMIDILKVYVDDDKLEEIKWGVALALKTEIEGEVDE